MTLAADVDSGRAQRSGQFCARLPVYSAGVRFGPWHPIDGAGAAAPEAPGLLQARADGLVTYPKGRSAMVLYAHSPERESLRAFVSSPGGIAGLARAAAARAAFVRYAEAANPRAAFERLLETFVERFGAPPLANAPRASAAGGSGNAPRAGGVLV